MRVRCVCQSWAKKRYRHIIGRFEILETKDIRRCAEKWSYWGRLRKHHCYLNPGLILNWKTKKRMFLYSLPSSILYWFTCMCSFMKINLLSLIWRKIEHRLPNNRQANSNFTIKSSADLVSLSSRLFLAHFVFRQRPVCLMKEIIGQ